MNIFIAGIATESTTFMPTLTAMGDFEAFELFHGDATGKLDRAVYGHVLAVWRGLAEGEGHRVHEGLCAAAEAGGVTEQATFERLRQELLDGVRAAGPLDLVLLNLHGAMVSTGCDDCEGAILADVRELVGPACTVAALLDLHCHLSERMVALADCLVAYKEYPHTDPLERAAELYRIGAAAARGQVRPCTAVFDCRMIGVWHTDAEPMRSFVGAMQAAERRPGILSVSLGHGFPWADVADVGAKLWVIADGDAALAARTAQALGRAFYALRARSAAPALPMDEVPAVLASGHGAPVVLADVADNPGGGAPGDATFLLRLLLDRRIQGAVIGFLCDPETVRQAHALGAGQRIRAAVGGRHGRVSGEPVSLDAQVRAVVRGHTQPGLLGTPERMGDAAWLHCDGIDLALCSMRTQVFSQEAFTGLGIRLDDKQVIVVKSGQHFHASFAPLAAAIHYVATPGCLGDPAGLRYTKRDQHYWPLVSDPLELGI